MERTLIAVVVCFFFGEGGVKLGFFLGKRVLENGVLRKIFGPKREKIAKWKNCIMRGFRICSPR